MESGRACYAPAVCDAMRRLALLPPLLLCIAVNSTSAAPAVVCAIDMGSNSFRRIVGHFADGKYTELSIDSNTMGVGDDVATNGQISDTKLLQILNVLQAYKTACSGDGVPNPVAVGTAAFRDAPNGDAVAKIEHVVLQVAA